jgi:hypothetical protein
MSLITASRPARSRFALTKPTALDRVIAHYARTHGMHVSPIMGCYQCLRNEPRVASRELSAAA